MRLSKIPGRRTAAAFGSAALLASVALVGGVLPAAASSTLYVGPGGGGGSCNAPAYATIQAAVAAATAGDTVSVCQGTYVETGQIVIARNLSIAGTNKATTIIKPGQDTSASYYDDSSAWILVNTGVTFNLSGVTLDGTGRLITNAIVSHGHGLIDGNTITGIAYNQSGPDYSGAGIALYGSDMTVSHNVFSAIGREGVFAAFFSTATVTGNVYTGKGAGNWLDYGIEVGHSSTAVISGNTITGNIGVATSDGSTSAGVLVSSYFDGTGTTSGATITGNTITGNTDGIEVGQDATDVAVVSAHHNVLSSNVHGVLSTQPTVDATDNWWGCNLGPGTSGCAGISGNVTFNPWLVLGVSAPSSILRGTTSTATGDVTHNSSGADTSPSGHIPDGTVISFSASAGTVSPASEGTTSGRAQVAFTANWAPGWGSVGATLDSQTVSTPVLVVAPAPPPPAPSPSPSPSPSPTPPHPPTLPKLAIGASSALGLNATSGYTTSTPKTQATGKYVTWKFTGGTALAGQRVNVMVAKKVGGVWGGPKYLKSAWADANGTVTFAWKSNTAAAINVRVQWPGSATYGVSTSAARGAYWK